MLLFYSLIYCVKEVYVEPKGLVWSGVVWCGEWGVGVRCGVVWCPEYILYFVLILTTIIISAGY